MVLKVIMCSLHKKLPIIFYIYSVTLLRKSANIQLIRLIVFLYDVKINNKISQYMMEDEHEQDVSSGGYAE